ncbi:MAG: succinylglutamate desuccinylase/aspartoacylase family protein [Gemmatimonadetes bacterium]|nr:succinylglutamate desuccinylase/aspartoacylase family protein [Gemmatimonadota bacterium]
MRLARCVIAAIATAATAPAARGQQPGPITIASVTARSGEMASGFIEVPAGVDSATGIPITVVRGTTRGPTLALIAGTHGSEVAPIVALQRVRQELDPARLAGTVILVQVANLPSFLRRTIYYGPVDGKNLNRVYPGRPDGTVSERIAYAITREVIERADYVVDMHAGDGNESLRPYSYWMPLSVDARVDSLAREMALAWGLDHIVVDTTRSRDPSASVYTSNTAMTRGKPAITTESGYLGMPVEEMVQRNVTGAFRLLRWLRMWPGEIEMVDHPVFLARTEVLRSPRTGIWYPLVERGHTVRSGTVLGYVTDYFGASRTEIRAPFAGAVLYVVGTPAMNEGEPVAMVGEPPREERR